MECFFGAPDFSQAWSFCVVVSEYYVWSADLSGRQSKTHANLKVRAPKPAKNVANLKAHLLGIRNCRAPQPTNKPMRTLRFALPKNYTCGKKRRLDEALFFGAPDFNLHDLFVWSFRSIMFGAPTFQVGK